MPSSHPWSNRRTRRPEAAFQADVRESALLGGWKAYHTHDSRRSDPGYPDLTLAHPQHHAVIFLELKSSTGKATPEQEAWIEALAATGGRVLAAIARPADLPALDRVLTSRSVLDAAIAYGDGWLYRERRRAA